MKISELQGLLSKVQNVVGDAEVILKAAEGGAETVLHTVGIELGASGDPTSQAVTVTHGEPAATPEPVAPQVGETAPAGDQAATHVPDGTQG